MNHSGNDNTDINIIIARYLSGDAAPDDIGRLREWIEDSPENKKTFFEQQDMWEALAPSFEVSDEDTEKAERRVMVKAGIMPRGFGIIKKLFVFWSRIAAVAILPLIAVTVYFLARPDNHVNQDVTLSTDYGCTSRASLPDGSIVWLNANSSLEYSRDMDDDTRDVNLRGEAYFDVHADPGHPFVVRTPYLSVTATGTEFNVNAYDPNASVTLAEGKVAVDEAGRRVGLLPGQHLAIKDGKTTVSKDVDLDKYCAWRNEVLIFEDEPIHTICRRLEQIYNVEFDIDPALDDRTFRFILKGENLGEIMNLFQLTAPVTCIAENNNHTADSINTRQIIHIKPI